ncbi:T9SS type A sorting domain-containing protein [Membranihabitans maritimus]|uniref:T9SS type A sorting domain-containing protein n=1 Tax=Membranihabitans maritimus TaxID=2904244 RepID=UPI001F386AA4|nr:T9SS type A sorting domain-containing protein [Membranihabitans maritimus]
MKTHLPFLFIFLMASVCVFGNNSPGNLEADLPVLDLGVPLVDDVSCHGESDGSVTILVAGLSLLGNYEYELTKDGVSEPIKEGGQGLISNLLDGLLEEDEDLDILNLGLTVRAEDLSAGDYTFSWTTNTLLGSSTQDVDFTVEEPDALEIIDLNIDDILSCVDPTGSIEVITTGGTGGLDLGILNLGEILNLGGEGNTITDLTEGVYSIIVEDENGCRDSASAEIENLIELPNLDITGSLELGCHELIDLGISTDDGVELLVDVPELDTDVEILGETLEVTTPGIYTFTALDPLTGCVSEEEVEVTADIDIPLLDAGTDRILGCLDELELEAITDATSIVWENLSGNVLTTNNILEVDAPGTYVAVASDAITGCEARDSVIIGPGDEDDNSILDFDAGAVLDLGCLNVADIVLINNDGITVDFDILGDVGEIIAGDDNKLTVGAPGTYVATGVSLVTQCLVSDTITVTADVSIGTLDIEQDTAYLDCDGTAVITADDTDLGVGANVQILWEVIEGDVVIDEDGTTAEVEGAGIIAVVATDLIKECTTGDTIVIENPGDVSSTAQVTNAVCAGEGNGAINLTVIGGVAPYEYSWSNGATTQDISNLTAGSYTVTITDSRGCMGEFTYMVEEPEQPEVSVDIMRGTGGNSVVEAEVSGGEAPYTYMWSTGSENPFISAGPGDYSLTVTDANGCSVAIQFTVDEDPDDPDDPDNPDDCDLVLDVETTFVMDSADATAEVLVTGGTAPFTYQWSTGATTSSVSGLSIGVYQVTVTDSEGCFLTVAFIIEKDPNVGPEGCPDDIVVEQCNSVVTYSAPEIVSDMDYSITQIEGLCSGSVFPVGTTTITYLIIFENGDYELCSFNVIVIPIELDFEVTLPSCYGSADGQIVFNVPDPEKKYYLFWDGAQVQEGDTASNLTAGTYKIKGMDESGCIINNTIILEQPDSLFLMNGIVLNSSDSTGNGQVQVTVQGGTYPYTYEWTGPDGFTSNQEDLYNITSGEYSLTVVDANGCTLSAGSFLVEDEVTQSLSGELRSFNQRSLVDKAKIYPNPSEGLLSMEVALDEASNLKVSIFNSLGTLVKENDFENIKETSINFDLSELTKGTYFIRLQTENGLMTKTLTLF